MSQGKGAPLKMKSENDIPFIYWKGTLPGEFNGNMLLNLSVEDKTIKRFDFKEKEKRGESWTLLIFFAVLCLFSFLKISKYKRLRQFIESFYSNRFVDQLIREEGLLASTVNIQLLLIASFINGLFCYQLIRIYAERNEMTNFGTISLFWLCFGLVAGFFLLKLILYGVTSILFNLKEKFPEYLFQYFLFFQATGIFLFPMVIGIEYLASVPQYSIAIVGVGGTMMLFLIRQIKVFYIGITSTSFSPFYIILYLCGLEILPIAILFKFLLDFFA